MGEASKANAAVGSAAVRVYEGPLSRLGAPWDRMMASTFPRPGMDRH